MLFAFYMLTKYALVDLWLTRKVNRDFMESYIFRPTHKEGFLNVVTEVLQNKRLAKLQDELEAEGKQVCMFNLYILFMFLVERGKARYIFLLKPTIQETLSALGEVSKITFTHKDDTTVKSTSEVLIKEVRKALEANREVMPILIKWKRW